MRVFNYYPHRHEADPEMEKKIFRYSLLMPGLFLLGFWMIFLIGVVLQLDLTKYGIYPLHAEGLKGIALSPFIHANLTHLSANSLPFLVLSFSLFYFYRKLAWPIFLLIYFLSGVCVWLGGREAWHVGASGLIYGLGAFLFFSGIFRNDVRLLTISVIVVFLYGGMFWGIFPIEPDISWESHLWGSMSGFALSIVYRTRGPQRSRYEWEDETETEEEDTESDEHSDPEAP
jgi:membrane associated rhomboid family serine protease